MSGARLPLALPYLALATALAATACRTPPGRPASASTEELAFLAVAPANPEKVAPAAGDELFVASVRPILKARCAPCHEPGGKMYDRMPFDEPSVVAFFEAGIRKRLQEPTEREALESWLRSRPAPIIPLHAPGT